MAFLCGFGSYVPPRIVTNQELADRLGCDAGWILSVSGIAQRRYAADAETVPDLGVRAAEDCLARTGVDRSQIGLVMVSSGSGTRRFPGPAAEVAQRLGLAGVPAIDLPVASAGSVFGLALASRLSETCGDVLLVAAEKMSAVVNQEPLDRNTAILFGDGAGACLVSPAGGRARVLDSCLHSDGSFADDLKLEFTGPLVMNGRTVILQVSRKIPAVIREVLTRNRRAADEIQTFLMHQANQNLTVRVAQVLEVGPERFYSNIERFGNTSSASMLIAAAEWSEQGGFRSQVPVVFAGFGAGFHWGAVLTLGE